MFGNRTGGFSHLPRIPRFRFTMRWGGQARLCLLGLSLAGSLFTSPLQRVYAESTAGKTDLFLTSALSRAPASGWFSVIVRIDGGLTPAKEAYLKALNVDIYRHLPIIHSVALCLPARNLTRLAALPFVRHVSADLTVKKCDEFTVGSSGANTTFQQYSLTGNGITVAVVDSGMNAWHRDLVDPISGNTRVLAGVNFVPTASKPNDDCGHGTHVAGIIAGNGACSTGSAFYRTFYGIARKANLVNVRVLDENGKSSVSTVLAGIQWVVNNAAAYNIRVLNLSLGHPAGDHYYNDPLCQACEAAWKAGIVVVCAAGNNGRQNTTQTAGLPNEGWDTAYGTIQSPGNDPYVITVGATKNMDGSRADDRIATYSSRGPTRLDFILKPDIIAPGNKVISLDVNNSTLDAAYGYTNQIPVASYCYTNSCKYSAQYFRLSGTSMAAPVVAGAAALLLEANPSLSPDTLKARLMLSADKWTDPSGNYDPCTYGAGYLNIPAALASTVTTGSYATSPPLTRDANGNVLINTILWGTNSPNGANILWETSGINLNIIWGSNIVWGTTILWGSNILWGATTWADNIIWGSSTDAVDLSTVVINGE